jgi:hypothetical protein
MTARDSSGGLQGIRLLHAVDVLNSVLPSLQRLAAEYGIEAWEPDRIAHIIEELRKLGAISFEEAKELYFCICVAVARSEDWKLTGETICGQTQHPAHSDVACVHMVAFFLGPFIRPAATAKAMLPMSTPRI